MFGSGELCSTIISSEKMNASATFILLRGISFLLLTLDVLILEGIL